jgi:hypothetical protein
LTARCSRCYQDAGCIVSLNGHATSRITSARSPGRHDRARETLRRSTAAGPSQRCSRPFGLVRCEGTDAIRNASPARIAIADLARSSTPL